MAKLITDDVLGPMVDGQRLEAGMTIRRYDDPPGKWFEGKVGRISGYDYDKQQRVSSLALVVEGYAPSPLIAGDIVEIVSKAELYNREMDKRNRIAYENREKPWLSGEESTRFFDSSDGGW